MLKLVLLTLATLAIPAVWGGEIASGGLGLSRAAWEARHGQPDTKAPQCSSTPLKCYERGRYITNGQGHVWILEIRFGEDSGPSRQVLQALVTRLIPTDAHLVKSYQKSNGWWIELYTSQSLATLDPLMHPEGLDLWYGSPPGTFTIHFEPEGQRVVIGTGGDI